MNPIRILHGADFHFDRENQEAALNSLETFYEHGRDNGVSLFVLAGDLFNRAVPNTGAAGFPRLVFEMQRMMNLAPVVAVKGTPTHDIDGCYEALQEINAKHSFIVLDPRRSYFLGADPDVHELPCPSGGWSLKFPGPDRLLILGCGEPSKEWFLADKEGLGRDEATQAVRDGMRQLLLGLGAIRKQYADLPCLMVYHGAVEGASLCNGQVLRPGELAIGRDDLALVGADYYALGHIHLAQQVGVLPAYYAGSAFPVNWGEVDQKGCNQVEIGENVPVTGEAQPASRFAVSVDRIPFPHPRRRKIVVEPSGPFDGLLSIAPQLGEIKGYQVWVVLRTQKESGILANGLTEMLLDAGALPGSRVTVEIIPTETVRAGEISAAQGLHDKLSIYALNSGEELPAGIAGKAWTLESEARAAGQAPEGLHVRIDRLRLRGAIGIWKGLGQDEIELDLDRFDPGLIALVGENGRGKTTLIENMHPYPEMLTRQGKLQDHFRLKDSYRDLYFTDERTGESYRALMLIDGANATGKAEYHLYRNGEPLTNGRKEDYEAKIQELFGSLSLFVRSAFVSQKPPKNHPDLTDATKGEKKALFRELAGLDYLQAYSESAREKAKALEAETERDIGKASALEELLANSTGKEDELTDLEVEREEKAEKLAELEQHGKAARGEVEELRQKVEAQRELHRRIEELLTRNKALDAEQEAIKKSRVGYENALAQREDAERILADYQALKEQEATLHAKKSAVLQERERLHLKYRNAEKAVADQRAKITAETAALSRKVAVLEQKKRAAIQRVDELTERLATQTQCPKCGHRFHPDAALLQEKLGAAQQTALNADVELETEVAALNQIKRVVVPDPEPPTLPTFNDSQLRELADLLAQFDEPAARKILATAQDAAARIEEGNKRRAQILEEMDRNAKQWGDLHDKLSGAEIEDAYNDKQVELMAIEVQYRAYRDQVAALGARMEALSKQLEELGQREQELADLRTALAGKQQDAAEWRWLERACGPDGIQALELDALGPSIADTANKLLSAAYGSRFQLSFRTTRIGGSGSQRRQLEDFQIWISDNEDGSEQLLETLSGGESIWIKRALFDAFGLMRDRNTGQRFLTVFMDEMDGALDPESRLKYFRMIESAHAESGRRHTIIVTHSEDAQEMIAQRINMGDLARVAEEVGA